MDEDSLRHEVCGLEEVPGLYLTDWVGASSVNEINILNITHILTILSAAELDQYGPDETKGVELRHLNILDKPSENIIQYFGREYEWLDSALKGGAVLVHCQQGISRSTAIVVAYLMKKLGITFDNAFAMVKKSRDIVNLNSGFREQLKVWGECQYDIYERDPSAKKGTGKLKEKPAYVAWKRSQELRINSDVVGKPADDEPNTATTMSPKTPVREVGVGEMIDFLDGERD